MSITAKQYSEVREYFKRLDAEHQKMNVKKVNTHMDEKEIRYVGYVKSGLVRVEQFGHALFGEWVTRYEAEGLLIHDPVKWLGDREKRKIKRFGNSCVDDE